MSWIEIGWSFSTGPYLCLQILSTTPVISFPSTLFLTAVILSHTFNLLPALQLSLLSLQKEHEKSRDNWKSSSHHLAEVHKMESEKFSFAKKTNELQSKLSQLENEIQEVKRKVREIELKEVGQEEGDELDQEA